MSGYISSALSSRLTHQALGIATSGLFFSWLLLGGSSPLSHWLSGQPHITNVASAVNLPTTLFALAGVPGSPPPSDLAIALLAAIQWLAYGFVLAWLWRMLRHSRSSKPTAVRRSA